MARNRDEDNGFVDWGSYEDAATDDDGYDDNEDEGSGLSFDKLEPGNSYRRVCPPPKGSGWGKDNRGKPIDSPIFRVWEHVVEDAEGNVTRFTCPKKHAGEDCRFCQESAKLIRSMSGKKKRIGFRWRARQSAYLQWFDTRSDASEEGRPEIKVFNAGKMVSDDLRDLRKRYGDFSHYKHGFELRVRRDGKGFDTRYEVSKQDDLSLEDFDIQPEDLFDLSEVVNVPSWEEQEELMDDLAELLEGGRSSRLAKTARRNLASREDGDDDDDRYSRRTKRRSSEDDDGGSRRAPREPRGGRSSNSSRSSGRSSRSSRERDSEASPRVPRRSRVKRQA